MKTQKFIFTGEVRRTVVDSITVVVHDTDEEAAAQKAKNVLETFPKPSDADVRYCYIENREQLDSEILSLEGKDRRYM